MSTHAAPSHDANRIIMRVPCRETPVTPPGVRILDSMVSNSMPVGTVIFSTTVSGEATA